MIRDGCLDLKPLPNNGYFFSGFVTQVRPTFSMNSRSDSQSSFVLLDYAKKADVQSPTLTSVNSEMVTPPTQVKGCWH